jgi:outer membrane lipoprotein-sorting protein
MSTLNRILTFALTFLTSLVIASTANADPAEVGRQIAEEVDRRDSGFVDNTSELKMILRNRHGQESVRMIRNRTLEVIGDGDKSLVIFDHPRDVKGTAFLSYTHIGNPDDQWLYLPALKRVKRISSKNKSGPFVGSEFAYEDISSQEVDKYTYRYLRDENLNGLDCFVVERIPVYKNSGYTKQIVWIDKAEYRPQKLDYYDRKEELLKTLTFGDYRQYLGRFWRAHRWEMVNHQTGKSTSLEWSEFQFQTGLSDRDFNRNILKSVR